MDQLLYQALVALGVVICSMVGFWLMIGRNLVTREEAGNMIQTESPYMNDRKFILESIKNNDEDKKKLTSAIEKITDVLTDLKVELAYIRKDRCDSHNNS